MAQRVEVVAVNKETGEVTRKTTASDDEDLYIAIFAYGLPRDIVHTNSQMSNSIYGGSIYSGFGITPPSITTGGYIGAYGVTQRHHTTKGVDYEITPDGNAANGTGYNVNHKIAFAYLVAPYNVDRDGNPDKESTEMLNWCVASGWDEALLNELAYTHSSDGIGVGKGASTLATTPTGCAAYRGIGGKDNPGTWRLPTQRESQVMFTIIEYAIALNVQYEIENTMAAGEYWTSTELFASGANWKAWANSSTSGSVANYEKSSLLYARCVRDIYYKVNE